MPATSHPARCPTQSAACLYLAQKADGGEFTVTDEEVLMLFASQAAAAVGLAATLCDLLRLLSVNVGRVVHHDAILRQAWGGRDGTDANLVRIFVRTLRRKLADSAENPTWIFNLRGVGYRMPRPGER